ncbi:MAG TPA: exodeoxyribonuclease VII small subunit [Cyanobacteria bacterium UBA12227]|nr:exodeoxyribonuclease VII small subunit [Cyanobacteria bacterium UBA12227]HAX88096.1 exodeoxyribonuclease VII small subunit [Cyanobacteria bacterium UBA11370]
MINPMNPSGANQTDISFPHSWNYEATVAEVERIIKQIESGELELAEVFDQFATAVDYLRQCDKFLSERKQQRDLLIETLVDESEF